MEEGEATSSVLRDNQWENELVRKENSDLSEEKRRLIVYTLLDIKQGMTLPWGAQTKLAAEVGVHKSTVNRLFKKAMQATQQGGSIDVSSKRFGKCGTKRKYQNNDEWLESCPLHLRGTVRSYAGYLGCSATHIWRLIKQGILRAHTSANHPHVSECNKLQRMKWVLNHIIPATKTEKAKFVEMKNVVHIDEKWFFLNPGTRRLYLLPKEVDPYRSSKSKNYSIKVMFLAATSRPIYAEDGHMLHDGKFGIWPFVFQEQAKNNSKNRLDGTWETKVETKITQISCN